MSKPDHTILFQNPNGLVGRFTTVRKGPKWADRLQRCGVEVVLADAKTETPIAVAEVENVWRGPLHLVPGLMLEMEHDPLCRTFSGLVACLQGIYGPPIMVEMPVSVLVLRVKRSSLVLAGRMTDKGPVEA